LRFGLSTACVGNFGGDLALSKKLGPKRHCQKRQGASGDEKKKAVIIHGAYSSDYFKGERNCS
jgi:hypothetical protein